MIQNSEVARLQHTHFTYIYRFVVSSFSFKISLHSHNHNHIIDLLLLFLQRFISFLSGVLAIKKIKKKIL